MDIIATTHTENVLSRLENVKRNGSGWKAACPAHDDRTPSLSVTENDNGVCLVHCHAGCGTDAVMAAIGLTMQDLFPADTRRPDYERLKLNGHSKPKKAETFETADEAIAALNRKHGVPAATWDYHNGKGELVGITVRWDNPDGSKRDIRPVSRGEDGQWRIKAMDEPRPLYRLGALSGRERIWIAEGEKCCDALAALGLPATTSPGGSKAASKADWRSLAGRECIILPDADEPGRRYAEAVASILERLGCTVRIVELPGLPEGGDIVDFIDDRRTDAKDDDAIKRELIDLAEQSEPWKPADNASSGPVLTCMADVEPCEVSWLWENRVPMGRITLLVGRPGEGKSFLTCDAASRVSVGRNWPDGSPCPSGSVLFVTAEDDPRDTIAPRLIAHDADLSRVHLLSAVRRLGEDGKPHDVMFTLADLPALEAALERVDDCRLLVVDPIGSFMGGRTDAHRDNEVRGVLAPLAQLAEKHGVAVLVVAHRRKSAGSIADDMALGSRAFTGIARAVWHLNRDSENKRRRLLLPGKQNLSEAGEGLAFTIEGHPPAIYWEPEPVTMDADEALAAEYAGGNDDRPERDSAREWLESALADGALPAADVKKQAKMNCITDATLRRAKADAGVVATRQGFGEAGQWYWELPSKVLTKGAQGEGVSAFGERERLWTGAIKNGDFDGDEQGSAPKGAQGENLSTYGESEPVAGRIGGEE